MPSTAVATVQNPAQRYELRSPIAKLLNEDAARAAIMPLLRPGDDYQRVIVEVYHAVTRNPDLAECDPKSIVTATARAVSTGLIIGETVDLLPFGKKVEVCIRYTGAIEMVQTSGAARYVDAQCVYENELCEIEQGTEATVRHRQILSESKRGPLIGAYAKAKVTKEDFRIVYMTVEEIDAIRLSKSKSWKNGPLSKIPWYAKKTVIKQLCKTLPKNRDLARVIAMLEREDEEQEATESVATYQLSDGTKTLQLGSASETVSEEGEPSEAGERAGDDDGAAPGPHRTGASSSGSSASSLATAQQKERIAYLLNDPHLDLADEERQRIAKIAGAKGYTADAASAQIAQLERLADGDDSTL